MEIEQPNWDIKPDDTETTQWLWNPLAEGGAKWVEVSIEEIERGKLEAQEIERNHPANQVIIAPEEIPSDIIS